jgi:hypothetical protein
MAKTKAQVIAAAVKDLGALAIGASIASEDSTDVGERYDALITTLSQSDVVTIADPVSGIPDYLFEPLVELLAQECAPMFGAKRDDDKAASAVDALRKLARQTYTVGGTLADKLAAEALRSLAALKPDEAPSTKDATFVSVRLTEAIADLYARDVIAYSSAGSITAETFSGLLSYVIELIAPKFGRPTNGDALSAAERRLATVTRSANTTSTVADKIIAEVLLGLGAIPVGTLPSTKDKTFVSGQLDNALADFTARDVVSIANQAAITAAQANDITAYLIEVCRPKFQTGKVGSIDLMRAAEKQLRLKARLATTAGGLLKDEVVAQVLRQLGRVPPGGNPSVLERGMVEQRLDRILADLDARNVISIPISASIEEAHVDALSDYVAEVLAPQLAVPPRPRDQGAKREAERALRTISRIGQGTGAMLTVERALLPRRTTFNFTTGQ